MDPALKKHVGAKKGSLGLTFDELTSISSNLVLAGKTVFVHRVRH